MAYNKKVWKDRIGTGLDKYLVGVADSRGRKTITSSPDSITQEGDVLNAESMNDLEDRIYNEFKLVWQTIGQLGDLLPVGGRIFYIDNDSDEVIQFFDENKQPLFDVEVGDTPAYYLVVKPSTNEKAKYYIYNPSIGEEKYWGYYMILTDVKSIAIGTGKTNTSAILSIYDTSEYNHDNIWTWLLEQRTNRLGGCDDWYIGSMGEIEELKQYLIANADGETIIDFIKGQGMSHYISVWASTEYNDEAAKKRGDASWIYDGVSKRSVGRCCAIRSF